MRIWGFYDFAKEHIYFVLTIAHIGEPWIELIGNFKRMAPLISNQEQLEKYLASINEQVKKYETDYDFLIAFNFIIRQIRERLKDKHSQNSKNLDEY